MALTIINRSNNVKVVSKRDKLAWASTAANRDYVDAVNIVNIADRSLKVATNLSNDANMKVIVSIKTKEATEIALTKAKAKVDMLRGANQGSWMQSYMSSYAVKRAEKNVIKRETALTGALDMVKFYELKAVRAANNVTPYTEGLVAANAGYAGKYETMTNARTLLDEIRAADTAEMMGPPEMDEDDHLMQWWLAAC
jgi:hypothetical protein